MNMQPSGRNPILQNAQANQPTASWNLIAQMLNEFIPGKEQELLELATKSQKHEERIENLKNCHNEFVKKQDKINIKQEQRVSAIEVILANAANKSDLDSVVLGLEETRAKTGELAEKKQVQLVQARLDRTKEQLIEMITQLSGDKDRQVFEILLDEYRNLKRTVEREQAKINEDKERMTKLKKRIDRYKRTNPGEPRSQLSQRNMDSEDSGDDDDNDSGMAGVPETFRQNHLGDATLSKRKPLKPLDFNASIHEQKCDHSIFDEACDCDHLPLARSSKKNNTAGKLVESKNMKVDEAKRFLKVINQKLRGVDIEKCSTNQISKLISSTFNSEEDQRWVIEVGYDVVVAESQAHKYFIVKYGDLSISFVFADQLPN